jgi:hypothetical protein
MKNVNSLRQHLMLGVSLAGGSLLAGYGRALAGACAPQNGTYICSGASSAATDVTQTINFPAIGTTATTTPGFGLDTSMTGGNAINLNGSGRFTDANGSSITGQSSGIIGYTNIGPLSVTTSGAVTAKTYTGIQLASGQASVGDLSVSANIVTAAGNAVVVNQQGVGAVSITTSGLVTSNGTHSGSAAIIAQDGGLGTGVTVSTAAITGVYTGISVRDGGLGAASDNHRGSKHGWRRHRRDRQQRGGDQYQGDV